LSVGSVPTNEYLITTNVLSQNEASIAFDVSGLSDQYRHLKIVFAARRADAAGTGLASAFLTFNGVTTGTSYAAHWLRGAGSTPTSSALTSRANIFLDNVFVRGTETAGAFSVGVIDILDAFNTNKNKTVRALFGGLTPNENTITIGSGFWASTAAITSITITPDGADLLQDSRFSVYGVTA
jgi:hypothetical protein